MFRKMKKKLNLKCRWLKLSQHRFRPQKGKDFRPPKSTISFWMKHYAILKYQLSSNRSFKKTAYSIVTHQKPLLILYYGSKRNLYKVRVEMEWTALSLNIAMRMNLWWCIYVSRLLSVIIQAVYSNKKWFASKSIGKLRSRQVASSRLS